MPYFSALLSMILIHVFSISHLSEWDQPKKIEEPINLKFSSGIPSDTLYVDQYSIDLDSNSEFDSYIINVNSLFEEKLNHFSTETFANLDKNSTTTVLVALTSMSISEAYNYSNLDNSDEINTTATAFVVVEIYEEGVKTFSMMFINEGRNEGEFESFEESYNASVRASIDLALKKIDEIFEGCESISCVITSDNASNTEANNNLNVINYSADGNLESFKPLRGCVGISTVGSDRSPADILLSSRYCIETEEFEKAVDLYFLSRAYAFFDIKRVKDGTAHQAILMLEESTFQTLSVDQNKSLDRFWPNETVSGKQKAISLCKKLREIDPPSYHPTYMIQHGLGAFTKSNDNGIVEDFNKESAWDEVLIEFGC